MMFLLVSTEERGDMMLVVVHIEERGYIILVVVPTMVLNSSIE